MLPLGNEGRGGHHFSGTVTGGQTLEVNFSVGTSLNSLYLTLWKDFVDTFQIELIAPTGGRTGLISPTQTTTRISTDETNIIVLQNNPVNYNEEQEILFLLEATENNTILEGIWQIIIIGTGIVDGRFDIWLPTVEEVTNDTQFLVPSPDSTLTLPSTSKNVITVGAYNSKINSIADFSGRGYTRNSVYVKPDLVAPGVGVLAPRIRGGYDAFTGTSAAAPFVTGAVAIIMEWGIVQNNDVFLYGQRVKSFLRKGAKREQNISYPNNTWGYGTLCIKNTLDLLQQYT